MTHLNTNRKATAKAVMHDDALGEKVILEIEDEGLDANRYVVSRSEAKALAEKLLKAAGVKFTLSI